MRREAEWSSFVEELSGGRQGTCTFCCKGVNAFHGVPQRADIWVSFPLFNNLSFLNVSVALLCTIHISCKAESLLEMLQL